MEFLGKSKEFRENGIPTEIQERKGKEEMFPHRHIANSITNRRKFIGIPLNFFFAINHSI